MAANEPIPDKNDALGRLFAALEGEDGIRNLASAIEHGDPEQLAHWYGLLSELSTVEIIEAVDHGHLGRPEFHQIFQAIHLLMQWEHTQAEELKEIVERETGEMAAREENWAEEREAMRAELHSLRERITAGVGIDNVHEAFRAEIDALSAENAQLKQLGRERDRELAEQRDRADELEGRMQGAERERTLLIGNQTQLEDTIRELNRRLSTRSEASQRGQEWESRKLRQRNEQALVLSDQVRQLAAQNDEFRAEVERLTKALEEATELIRENGRRFLEFDEQFGEAEKQIERLVGDNRELREMLAEKEQELKRRADKVELSNREFAELLHEKDTQIERQRGQLQRQNLELETLAKSQHELVEPAEMEMRVQKEAELERLRLELVAATESARRLFGEEMVAEEELKMAERGSHEMRPSDGMAEMRLRLVQMDRELEKAETELREAKRRERELETAVEGKDLQIARLLADCQRYRKMAFGDSDAEIRRIEGQLVFREKQIEALTKRCSELQIELEKKEIGKEEEELEGKKEEKDEEKGKKKKIPMERKEIGTIPESRKEEEMEIEKMDEPIIVEEYRIERMEEEEEEGEEDEEVKLKEEKVEEKQSPSKKEIELAKEMSRKEMLDEAIKLNVLQAGLSRLVNELEEKERELANLQKLYEERGKHLMAAKEAESRAQRQFVELKETLLFGEGEIFEETAFEGNDGEKDDALCNETPKSRNTESRNAEITKHRIGEASRNTEITKHRKGESVTIHRKFELMGEFFGSIYQSTRLDELIPNMLLIRSRERLESLELENMELRRLAENLAQNGDEKERRMAESTRRLVYLAVREAKLERRVKIGQRLRKAMVEELEGMRMRMRRLLTHEEAQSRQLALENEAKLFELARLQNSLLHSVPIGEYNRVLKENKKLLRDRFLESPDAGYHSAAETVEDDLEFAKNMDISRAGLLFGHSSGNSSMDSTNSLMQKCRRLQETNDILVSQNESLKAEQRKMEAELAELNAFLDDLEAETELKSMMANIERRFLQAIREQFDAAEERESLQRELQRMDRNFRRDRDEWLTERKTLVNLVGQLHSAHQRLQREMAISPIQISMTQLEALAKKLREMREKEAEITKRADELERKELEFGQRINAFEAKREALETIVANDWQIGQIECALQGYQLNVLTMGGELERTRKKLEKAEQELKERIQELDELKQTSAEFQFILGMDLKALEQKLASPMTTQLNGKELREKLEEKKTELEVEPKIGAEELAEKSFEGIGKQMPAAATKVIVLNNSAEWEEQLRIVREQARICVDSYKDQLERKEKSLEEYRTLVEQLKAEMNKKEEGGATLSTAKSEEKGGKERPKSSEELLGEEERKEQWERRIRALDGRVRMLEMENAEMETERMRLVEMLRKRMEEKVNRRNVQIQVNLIGKDEKKKETEVDGGVGMKKKKKKTEEIKVNEEEKEDEKEESLSTSSEEEEKKNGQDEVEKTEEEEEEEETPESSDSGTVEDMGRENGRQRGSRSSSVGELNRSQSSAGTRTIQRTIGMAQKGDEKVETMVLRHRNETRKLRMRIIELERRNRELTEQYASLRERARLAARPHTSAIDVGSSGTVEATLRKENERLQRLNANLNKSANGQRQEFEEMQKRLRRAEAQSKAGAELWEERKRHEQQMAAAKRKILEAEERERELRERMDRRERHIEQLGKEREGRLADGERLQVALRHWREEKAELEKKLQQLGDERRALADRNVELMGRLEALAKENRSALKRVEMAQQREKKLMAQMVAEKVETGLKEAQTQTENQPKIGPKLVSSRTDSGRIGGHYSSTASSAPETARPNLATKIVNEDLAKERGEMMEWRRRAQELEAENSTMAKQYRRAELLQKETTEQLETLRQVHAQLMEDYNGLIRVGKELELRRSSRDEEETVGLALLRDKLGARERELELQRRRILDLERQIWQSEMRRTKD